MASTVGKLSLQIEMRRRWWWWPVYLAGAALCFLRLLSFEQIDRFADWLTWHGTEFRPVVVAVPDDGKA